MAAPYNPPIKGQDFVFYVALADVGTQGSYKASPTLASGDFKISKDGSALANLATLPTNTPSGSVMVKVELSTTEMNADNVTLVFIDQTSPKEWADFVVNIVTTSA